MKEVPPKNFSRICLRKAPTAQGENLRKPLQKNVRCGTIDKVIGQKAI